MKKVVQLVREVKAFICQSLHKLVACSCKSAAKQKKGEPIFDYVCSSRTHLYFFLVLLLQEQQQKLANLKYVLQETTDVSNDLVERYPDEDETNAEVTERVTKVADLYQEVSDSVDGILTTQKESLAKRGEFQTLFESFLAKVDSFEERLQSVKPLSTKLPILKEEEENLMVS